MTVSAGARLGAYQVVGPLGAGGMGEVYRAKDLKLKRDVAIKVLPEAFSRDSDRLARFQREAEVLASLNHPHIAAIHELAESGGTQFLVLELVEGETLAHRIARGPIPIDESLAIAKQIAEALEAAHDRGIIHRDLKPSNIMLTARGAPPRAEDRHLERRLSPEGDDATVKVLDFGLAKVRESELTYASLTQSPTMMTASASGVILGSAAYMSPEQAKGKDADRTSDVWAFGCVLYEMLSGRRAFEGETVSELLAEVLKAEPDWQRVPADTPPAIRRLLGRCLRKDRKHRLHDIADARLEIEEVGNEPDGRVPAARPAPRGIERVAWMSAVVLLSFVAAVAMAWAVRPVARPSEMRLDISTPPTTDPVSLALSPDGQKITFVAMSEGRPVLWLRGLESTSARPLPGTDNASFPFWSPDARSLGFFSEGRLKRIDIDGGSVQVLANAPVGRGGTWNADGVILYAPSGAANPIFRVAATGGEPVAVTRINAPEQNGHVLPQFLPDGRRFIYYVSGSPAARGLHVGQIEGSESQRLFDVGSPAVFAASGYLLFTRQGALYAQPVDVKRLQLSGTEFSVAAQVATATVVGVSGIAAVSASAAGPIVFRAGPGGSQRQLMWVDRSGKALGKVGDADTAGLINPSMSPDGRRVALQRNVGGNTDVWLLETARGVLTRFTFDAATDGFPIWSPDGTRIVFSSARTGALDLFQKSITGTGGEERALGTTENKVPMDWSLDGRVILYRSTGPKTGFDLWALPRDGDRPSTGSGRPEPVEGRKPFPLVQTNFEENDGQFSPDGKWIAFQSNESGRHEIYVQSFPGPGAKSPVSTNGGGQARWRRDGRELFYIGLDGRLMAVSIRLASDGQSVEAGTPFALFATHIGGAVQGVNMWQYLVSADGQRFLMNTTLEDANTSPMTIILNWKAKP